MKKTLALLATLLLLIVPVAGCAPVANDATSGDLSQDTPAGSSAGDTSQDREATISDNGPDDEEGASTQDASEETGDTVGGGSTQPNFRLLVSDEKNDIEDFEELWITVVGIGLVQGDEAGVAEEWFKSEDIAEVNLRELQDDLAVETWVGHIEPGEYVKVFLYVDDVWGVLVDAVGGEEPEIKLPSDKLQLKLPVRIDDAEEGEEPELVDFVFDITVHEAGNSGQYILSPQASESGQGKTYRLLEQTAERILKGKPDFTGKREDTGKPEWAAQPGGRGFDDDEEETEDEDA